MAPLDDLSPAGSSSYSSNTMNVGDGTWDATRNDFLLPNLVGLNFDTMQYNGKFCGRIPVQRTEADERCKQEWETVLRASPNTIPS